MKTPYTLLRTDSNFWAIESGLEKHNLYSNNHSETVCLKYGGGPIDGRIRPDPGSCEGQANCSFNGASFKRSYLLRSAANALGGVFLAKSSST